MRKTILCLLALAVPAVFSGGARADDDGEKLLRGLADAYKAADSLSYDLKITQSASATGAQPTEIEAKLSLKKPNLAKVEVSSKAQGYDAALVCDGTTVWECSPPKKVCLKKYVPDDPADMAGRMGGLRYCDIGTFFSSDPYAKLTVNSINVTASKPESVDGVECDVAVVDYGRHKEKLYIGKDDHILCKTAIIVTPAEGEKEQEMMSDLLRDVKVNRQIPESTFAAPELAEGTKIIEVPRMKDDVIVAGQKAPEFTVKTIDGKDVSLSAYKGKILLVDFWASWCGPCKAVIPKLKELHNEFGKKGLTVIGLDVWDQEDAMKKAIKDLEIDYTVLYAPREGSIVDLQYGVEGIPTVYLIDKEGVIRGGWIGADPAHEEAMRKALAELGIK